MGAKVVVAVTLVAVVAVAGAYYAFQHHGQTEPVTGGEILTGDETGTMSIQIEELESLVNSIPPGELAEGRSKDCCT